MSKYPQDLINLINLLFIFLIKKFEYILMKMKTVLTRFLTSFCYVESILRIIVVISIADAVDAR